MDSEHETTDCPTWLKYKLNLPKKKKVISQNQTLTKKSNAECKVLEGTTKVGKDIEMRWKYPKITVNR